MDSAPPPTLQETIHLIQLSLSDIQKTKNDEIHQCGQPALSILQKFPDAAMQMAYQKLNDVPYRDVKTCWRRLYADAGLWKVLGILEEVEDGKGMRGVGNGNGIGERLGNETEGGWITEVVRTLDMALILTGAPRREEVIELVFSCLEGVIEEEEQAGTHSAHSSSHGNDTEADDSSDIRQSKRRKITTSTSTYTHIPPTFPTTLENPPRLRHPITRHHRPTLSAFERLINDPATCKPLIIEEAISFWPALSDEGRCWHDPRYLLKHTLGGRRLVPVEIGRAYTDEGWGQKILSFGEFMSTYMFNSPAEENEEDEGEREGNKSITRPNANNHALTSKSKSNPAPSTGYLAQHDLLAQIPSLRADIAIPDYCYADAPAPPPNIKPQPKLDDPLLNAWFGPTHTISPLHTDPYHNILAQVVGYKYVRLYSPAQTAVLHSRGVDERGVDMGNTSSVDLDEAMGLFGGISCWGDDRGNNGDNEDEGQRIAERRSEFEAQFPGFKDAAYVEGVLGPGDCLYIPAGWWHYVRSLTPSFSVSFWWN